MTLAIFIGFQISKGFLPLIRSGVPDESKFFQSPPTLGEIVSLLFAAY